MSLRVLLDTNVWAYVARDEGAHDLRRVARKHDLEVLVSPAVVFEQLRDRDWRRRVKQLSVTTRSWWTRLMPEAFVECEELVRTLRSRRPTWLLSSPPPGTHETYELNRDDWTSGFWARARSMPNRQARYNQDLGDNRIAVARQQVAARRTEVQRSKANLDQVALDAPDIESVQVLLPDGEPMIVKSWQLGAANHLSLSLSGQLGEGRTFLDWLEPFVDVRRFADARAWIEFWSEVSPAEAPTEWLAWAAGALAPYARVNDGTVFDVQLCNYLAAADFLVTADRNLHRVVGVIARDAPFRTASSVRTSPTGWLNNLQQLAGSA